MLSTTLQLKQLILLYISLALTLTLSARAESLSVRPWKNEIVYQLMVDRFFDGDVKNNTPSDTGPLRYRNGDIQGIILKLDYIKNLGATAILHNPIVKGDAYHGYAISDPFSIDPHYGTLEDYRKLIREAHARGIKVIFDLVLNHMSGRSTLVKERPEWFRPVVRSTAVNDGLLDEIWPKTTFYLLSDFIHEREDVYGYLLSVAKFWVDVGVDGFRFDAVTLGTPEFWQRFGTDVRRFAPENFLLLGEVFTEDQDRLNRYLGAFNAFFDFPLFQSFYDIFLQGAHPALLRTILSLDALYKNKEALPFTIIDNHDVARFVTRVREQGIERAKLALSFLMMTRGVPTIFYGTEIALGDDPTLMHQDWDRSRNSMQFKDNEQHSLYQHLKDLIALRKEYNLGSSQRYDIVDRSLAPFWVAVMKDERDRFVIATFNFSPKPAPNSLFRLFAPGLPRDARLKPIVGGGKEVIVREGLATFELNALESRFYLVEANVGIKD